MQFQVPQNIDLEDKVIGPLTLRQFISLLVGGMANYIFYLTLGKNNILAFVLFALPITLFSIAWAFAKVQDQPFPHFVASFVLFLIKPRIRTWGPTNMKPKVIYGLEKPEEKIRIHAKKQEITRSQLSELAKTLDMYGWEESKKLAKTKKGSLEKQKTKDEEKPAAVILSQTEVGDNVTKKGKIKSENQTENNSSKNTGVSLEGRVKSHETVKPIINVGQKPGEKLDDVLNDQ